MYPPKVVKKPMFWQITQNSPTIFRFGPREMETPNFTVNCAKSTQFANPYSESCEISQICAVLVRPIYLLLDIRKAGSNTLLA